MLFTLKHRKTFFENGFEKLINKGATVLVKASRGMHFEKTAEKIQEVK